MKQLLIFYFLISTILSFENLNHKSIFFSSLDISQEIKNESFIFSQTHKTDLIIEKYESIIKNNITPNNSISIYINSLYYKIVICLDTKYPGYYTLKNRLKQHVSTYHYKNSDSYTSLEDDKNYYCIERIEYIDKKMNLYEKNSLLDKNFWYNLINNEKKTIDIPLIESMLNIHFFETHEKIKKLFEKNIIKWNDNCSYELVLYFDTEKNLFVLNKVFLYYYGNIIKLNINQNLFENVFMFHKKLNKIYKYSSNYKNSNEKKFTKKNFQNIYMYNYKYKIKTNKKTSVYHNTMEIQLNEKILNDFYKKYKKSKSNSLCYLIHEILTEDVYIEKNEFKNLVNEYMEKKGINIKYNLYASRFIEQELSSDLSEQSYFSFYFCSTYEQMKKINFNIKFPIHFRYQPSLNENSNQTHQIVMMPHPYFHILNPKENTLKNYISDFYDKILYKSNIYEKDEVNNRKLFCKEIKIKMNTILNEQNILLYNYEQLKHKIPAGQMKYFWPIVFVTTITSIIGFCIICFGLIKLVLSTINESDYETPKIKKE
jgi:hypothetical protein